MSKRSNWDGREGDNGAVSSEKIRVHKPGHGGGLEAWPRMPEFSVYFITISNKGPWYWNHTLAHFLFSLGHV